MHFLVMDTDTHAHFYNTLLNENARMHALMICIKGDERIVMKDDKLDF